MKNCILYMVFYLTLKSPLRDVFPVILRDQDFITSQIKCIAPLPPCLVTDTKGQDSIINVYGSITWALLTSRPVGRKRGEQELIHRMVSLSTFLDSFLGVTHEVKSGDRLHGHVHACTGGGEGVSERERRGDSEIKLTVTVLLSTVECSVE